MPKSALAHTLQNLRALVLEFSKAYPRVGVACTISVIAVCAAPVIDLLGFAVAARVVTAILLLCFLVIARNASPYEAPEYAVLKAAFGAGAATFSLIAWKEICGPEYFQLSYASVTGGLAVYAVHDRRAPADERGLAVAEAMTALLIAVGLTVFLIENRTAFSDDQKAPWLWFHILAVTVGMVTRLSDSELGNSSGLGLLGYAIGTVIAYSWLIFFGLVLFAPVALFLPAR